MAVVSYPGVYVEEVSSGVRPIAAASTSTAAFVGQAEMGPDDESLRVTNWTEFQKFYGSFIKDGYLAESVLQFFSNGGQQCYVVRVTRSDAAAASVTLQNRANLPTSGIKFTAKSKGEWGNYLYLQIENGTNDPGNEFKISARWQQAPDFVPSDFANIAPLEVHDNLSIDKDASNYVVKILKQNSNLITAEVLATNTALQRGLHRGGIGSSLPLGINRSFQINVDNDGYHVINLPDTLATSVSLTEISTAITTLVQALVTQKKKSSTPNAAFTGFTSTVEGTGANQRLLLQSGTNTAGGAQNPLSSIRIQNASVNNATLVLKLGAANGGISEDGLALRRPANVSAVQVGDNALEGVVAAVTLGSNGSATITDASYANQFKLLDNKTDFSLLAVPGVGSTVMFDLGVAYCEGRPLRDVFYIGDMDSTDDSASEAEVFRKAITKPNSYGAIYFPWIKALDPSGRSTEPVLLPPSGYIAGLYARIDSTRGVWKAPAGTEATLNRAMGLAINLTDVQQGNLNRINVNCLRQFPASGLVSWGARTVTSDPEYQYVPVRRMAIMLRVSVYNGIQWAVFEPNDEDLWAQLRMNLGSFMMVLYRQGAFQGSTPSQAFFVKCDGETTTQDDINLGIVNVLIGFAPLKPAEFIVVKISQKAGQNT